MIALAVLFGTAAGYCIGRGTRARLQRGPAPTPRCACTHPAALHTEADDVTCCTTCGDNTHCDYAPLVVISADRFDEGYITAVEHFTPRELTGFERLLWAVEHAPRDNSYREQVRS